MQSRSVKKEIMFITGEDYNFYAYSVIVLLFHLGCHGVRWFKDCRKLSHIIPLVTTSSAFSTLERCKNGYEITSSEKLVVSQNYSDSIVRMNDVNKLLFALNQNELVNIERGREMTWDCQLDMTDALRAFISDSIFNDEKQRVITLKKIVPKLSFVKYETFIERVYKDCGVETWAV